MKSIQLLHNPKAGDELHSKEYLMQALESRGYMVHYTSSKDDAASINKDVDLVVIAGGDGTVRKAVGMLLEDAGRPMPPVTILRLGTANNIARTFNIGEDLEAAIDSWDNADVIPLNVGEIEFSDQKNYFVESVGFGLFPFHVAQMWSASDELADNSPEEKKAIDLSRLVDNIEKVVPIHYDIQVDGEFYSGEYIMAEVMNMPAIGTNLLFSPLSDPTDDQLELVLAKEDEKDLLMEYVMGKMSGHPYGISLPTLRGKEILIKSTFTRFHIDDELVESLAGNTSYIKTGLMKIPFLRGAVI